MRVAPSPSSARRTAASRITTGGPAHRIRCRTAVLARGIAAAVLGLATIAGCDTLDDAKLVVDRADLVNDLANRLDQSSELTYFAQYQLASGETAGMAQAQTPVRSAYTYPGGTVVINPTAVTRCKTVSSATTCTVTTPPAANAAPATDVLDAARAQGLVAPTLVITLLTAAALDRDAVIEQSDNTIAGQHATCVDVSQVKNAPASAFKACITTDGVLGSFSGVVSGEALETSLVKYTEAVPAAAFDLPTGAKVVDHRHTPDR